ncbi:MAG: hypothetical protein CL663_00745 [Bacteroidetes bacterium]|nr:hypothetical protein [Bacteroidota bacterium]
MKALKRSLWFVSFLLIVAIVINSCGKNTIDVNNPDEPLNGIHSLNVPANFDWKTSSNYSFVFSNGTFGVVEVTSVDNSAVYHRGSYIENSNGDYVANINLPTFVTQVRINGDIHDLTGPVINVDMVLKAAPTNYKVDFTPNAFALFGTITELDLAAAFTIEGWAIVDDWSVAGAIFDRPSGVASEISLSNNVSGELVITLNGTTTSSATYNPSLANGDCFHFAVVYDGSLVANEDKIKLFINGSNVGLVGGDFTGTVPATTATGGGVFTVGYGTTKGFFDGSVDELRIWDDARTPTEISDNRLVSLVGNEANLVAYYQFNEGSGTSAADKAGNYPSTGFFGVAWSVNTCNSAAAWLDDDFDGIPDASDDYPEDPLRAYDNHWPAADTGTLIFEDLYPGFGDYDFNDMVLGYKFKTVTSATNKVVEIFSYTKVRAHGAQLDNGFGYQLPNADAGLLTDLTVTGYNHTGSLVTLNGNGLEAGQAKPVVIVLDKVSNVMDKFVNTHETGATASPVTITVTMTPTADYEMSDFSLNTWNPFLIIDQTRGYELHLADYPPTDLGSTSYFGTFEDASNPGAGDYYVTAANLPWALDFPTAFEYPFEKKEITAAYLHFREWAESGGASYTDWYSNTAAGYRNAIYIYTP